MNYFNTHFVQHFFHLFDFFDSGYTNLICFIFVAFLEISDLASISRVCKGFYDVSNLCWQQVFPKLLQSYRRVSLSDSIESTYYDNPFSTTNCALDIDTVVHRLEAKATLVFDATETSAASINTECTTPQLCSFKELCKQFTNAFDKPIDVFIVQLNNDILQYHYQLFWLSPNTIKQLDTEELPVNIELLSYYYNKFHVFLFAVENLFWSTSCIEVLEMQPLELDHLAPILQKHDMIARVLACQRKHVVSSVTNAPSSRNRSFAFTNDNKCLFDLYNPEVLLTKQQRITTKQIILHKQQPSTMCSPAIRHFGKQKVAVQMKINIQ